MSISYSIRRLFLAAAAIAAAACAYGAPARAAAICGEGTYAYAGFDGRGTTRGVSATIGQAGPLQVRDGHVAGWIGIVDPNTDAAWLQVGLSAMPNDTSSAIYYEVAFPGQKPTYHLLRSDIAIGESHRFAVLEVPHRPSWWRVWLDGRPVTVALHLRGSHGRWSAQALGESWAGTASGACNSYAYSFGDVSLLSRDERLPALHDPNYVVLRRSPSGFLASSVGDQVVS